MVLTVGHGPIFAPPGTLPFEMAISAPGNSYHNPSTWFRDRHDGPKVLEVLRPV